MGKDGTQLLRHCVRLLVLVSTDLVAVRLSGIPFYLSVIDFLFICLPCNCLMTHSLLDNFFCYSLFVFIFYI